MPWDSSGSWRVSSSARVSSVARDFAVVRLFELREELPRGDAELARLREVRPFEREPELLLREVDVFFFSAISAS
jgi:hypothetical protein